MSCILSYPAEFTDTLCSALVAFHLERLTKSFQLSVLVPLKLEVSLMGDI
jgi:hypothetical protein